MNASLDPSEPLIDDLHKNAVKVHTGFLMKRQGNIFGRDQLRFFELFSDGRIRYCTKLKKGVLDYRGTAFLDGDTFLIKSEKNQNTIEFKSARK